MDKGTYILKIKVKKNLKISVGSLGEVNFKLGTYVYIGSAMNSISKRVQRHVKKNKKVHWHLDYLTISPYVEIEKVYAFYGSRVEEEISMKFSKRYDSVNNFGASDMKSVNSNLYFVNDDMDEFVESLGGVSFETFFPGNS